MRPIRSGQPNASAERVVKDIRRAARRHFFAEDNIRIVLEDLRGDDSIAEAKYCAEPVLHLVQGVHGSWQPQACWQHCLCGHQWQVAAPAVKRALKECVADFNLENLLLDPFSSVRCLWNRTLKD